MHHSILREAFILVAIGLLVSACTTTTSSSVEMGVSTDAEGTARTTIVTGTENPRFASIKEKIVSDGARQMNREEVTAYLSNKTQQWSNGGAFYDADGTLDFIWEGKTFYDYSWSARKDGLVCIKNYEGFSTSCSLYFNYKQTVWTVVTEVFGESKDFFGGPDTTVDGNKLSDLEPWDPAMSGN